MGSSTDRLRWAERAAEVRLHGGTSHLRCVSTQCCIVVIPVFYNVISCIHYVLSSGQLLHSYSWLLVVCS
ncbi:unnamed protein product [Heligmosomoides polygyrus]|uniref:Uncharacterized protein n=1 Tax=Heligmosomoides polygyrus TaxID=6339 RepID=A0A183GUY5_HELPZ|nr:unnamed protein product [Heligmosomoides polygyrus]